MYQKQYLTGLLIASLLSLSAIELVKNGKPVAVIQIPASPLPVETFAAQELVLHIEKATTAKLPIVKGGNPSGNVIRLGRAAELKRNWKNFNDATIRISADKLDIAGVDGKGNALDRRTAAGTLFGVYDLLNNELGVRHLWPGETGMVVPKKKDVTLHTGERNITSPLCFTNWRTYLRLGGWQDQSTGKRFFNEENLYLRRHRFTMSENLNYGHAFTDYYRRFGKTHPEYFNLLPNGLRVPDPFYFNGRPDLISMCVTNQDFIAQVVANWKKQGGRSILNLNENDTLGKCICPDCLTADDSSDLTRLKRAREAFIKKNPKWAHELGSLSNRYAKFFLAVQKEADKINPQHKIIGCIYANYYEPPNVKLNNRMIMRFCPPIMYPWNQNKVNTYKRLWKGWADSGVQMMLRPNFTLDGHGFPLVYYPEFVECFDFALNNNLTATDLDSLSGIFGTNGLTLYIIAARHGEGREKSIAELENDYFQAFGAAEPQIREYYKLMRKATERGKKVILKDDNGVEGGSPQDFFRVAHLIFTTEVMTRGMELLDEAARQVVSDPAASSRVDFLKTGLTDAQLVLKTQKAFIAFQKNGQAKIFKDAFKELNAFRAANESKHYADLGFLASYEGRIWPLHLAMLNDDGRELSDWRIKFDPKKEGDKIGGHNVRPDKNWPTISTTTHWERQPAGLAWEKKYGAPYKGTAWYGTTFNLTQKENQASLKLCFGAIDGNAEVYLNGKKILERPYPYKGDSESWKKPFEIIIPSNILKTKDNSLVIRVEKHDGLSGIWRPVFLERNIPSPPPMTQNQLKNGNFISGKLGAWHTNIQTGRFKFQIVDDTTGSTKKVLQITCMEAEKSKQASWGRIYQNVKLIPGTVYRFRCRFKTLPGFTGKVEIWLRSSKKRGISKANVNLSAIGTDGTWQELTGSVVPENNNCTVYINLIGGTGTLSIDQIQLYQEQ